MEHPKPDDEHCYYTDSEGTSPDEDLEKPVTQLDHEFFKDIKCGEFEMFRKYFKAIKKNRYLLTLIDNVLMRRDPCPINTNTVKPKDQRRTHHPLPKVCGKPQKGNPGASNKIKLTETPKKGKGFEAVSEINVGDNIIVEKALAHQFLTSCACRDILNYTCYHCCTPIFKYVPCEHCDTCLFCDETCLKKAWIAYHQYECYGLQRHFWTDVYSHMGFRLMTLCLNKITPSSNPKHIAESIQKFHVLQNIKTQMEKFSIREMNEVLHESARSLIYLIERTRFFENLMLGKGKPPYRPYYMYMYTGGLLVRYTCASRVSTLLVQIERFLGDVGDPPESGALFVCRNASLINHSCEPNCVVLHNKTHVIIRAIKHIKPKEEITIAYFPITCTMPFKTRQWYCQKYFFTCTCDLCLSGTVDAHFLNTYICNFCKEGRAVYDGNSIICIDCKKEGDLNKFKADLNAAERLLAEYTQCSNLYNATRCLTALQKVFFPSNYRLYIAYQHLYRCFLDYEAYFFKGCELVLELIDIYRHHVDEMSLELGYIIYKAVLQAMIHDNFKTAKWTKHKIPMLTQFKQSLLDSKKILSIYYPPDRLEFFKNALNVLEDNLELLK